MSSLKSTFEFIEKYPWLKPISREMLEFFFRKLASHDRFIFEIKNEIGELAAVSILLDQIKNLGNTANLEVLAIKTGVDPEWVYSESIKRAAHVLPEHFDGFQVSFPEGFIPAKSLAKQFHLTPYYDIYEMECDLTQDRSGEPAISSEALSEKDYRELYGVLEQSFAENPDTNIPDFPVWLDRRYKNHQMHTWGIRIQGKLVAFVNLQLGDERGVSEVSTLGTLPEFRGNGFGRALLIRALNEAILLKSTKCLLGVAVQNKKALKLYQSLGFKKANLVHVLKFSSKG